MSKRLCSSCGFKTTKKKCPQCGSTEENSYSTLKTKKAKMITNIGRISVIYLFISLIFSDTNNKDASMPEPEEGGGKGATKIMYVDEEAGEYRFIEDVMNLKGDSYTVTLPQGDYKVGVHIPEGTYTATTVNHDSLLSISDDKNFINSTQYSSDHNVNNPDEFVEYQNVLLFNGATLGLNNNYTVKLSTENAQTSKMKKLEPNTVIESFEVKDGDVSGVDFPVGTYDIDIKATEDGYGTVQQIHSDNSTSKKELVPGGNSLHYNVEYPKGAKIVLDKATVTFTTSKFNTIEKEED